MANLSTQASLGVFGNDWWIPCSMPLFVAGTVHDWSRGAQTLLLSLLTCVTDIERWEERQGRPSRPW
jgi:hypothetical protein